jgi:hypothetical protein
MGIGFFVLSNSWEPTILVDERELHSLWVLIRLILTRRFFEICKFYFIFAPISFHWKVCVHFRTLTVQLHSGQSILDCVGSNLPYSLSCYLQIVVVEIFAISYRYMVAALEVSVGWTQEESLGAAMAQKTWALKDLSWKTALRFFLHHLFPWALWACSYLVVEFQLFFFILSRFHQSGRDL